MFTCLPFGLAPAPLMFTKLLKLVPLFRCPGLRMIICPDDINFLNKTHESIPRSSVMNVMQITNITSSSQALANITQAASTLACAARQSAVSGKVVSDK